VAQGVDGRWSAVDGRRVFAHAQAVQAVYHARLRLEIGERLGATFEVAPSGLGDVLGVDGSLRRLFSQRAAAMDEYRYLRAGGPGADRPSRGAFHATRPDKDRTRTVESLSAEWRERAAMFGIDLGDLTAVVGRPREVDGNRAAVDRGRVGTALGALARHGRSVARRDLVAAVAAASIVGATAAEIESAANRLIELAGPSATATDRLDRAGRARNRIAAPEPRWRAEELVRGLEDDRRGPAARGTETALAGRAPTGPDAPGHDRHLTPLRRPDAGLDLGRT
jgi:hypothetical protein